jgi:hypothetical protein
VIFASAHVSEIFHESHFYALTSVVELKRGENEENQEKKLPAKF